MAVKITFLGHSTLLISSGEAHFLTDPLFVSRIMVVKRKLPLGMEPESLPPLSAVTLSHAHTDHMNMPSLRRLPRETPFLVPTGCARFLTGKGFTSTEELDTWQRAERAGVSITALPVNHVRGRFFPWQDTGVASYLFELDGHNLLVAGDVDFGPLDSFKEIARRHRIDTICLPVGGMREVAFYNKRRGKKGVHIDPETALEIFKVVNAKHLIPIHWGAITIAKTPRDEAPQRLLECARKEGLERSIKILYPGESRNLS